MTFFDPSQSATTSACPAGWYGTSMSTPQVSAAAALVIASGVIGPHPTPDQILARLERRRSRSGAAEAEPRLRVRARRRWRGDRADAATAPATSPAGHH